MQRIIDKKQVAANRARAERLAKPGVDFLLERALHELSDRMAVTARRFDRAIGVGRHSAQIVACLRETGKTDICEPAAFDPDERLDVEPASADLVVSLLDLHEFDDVPGALVQLRRALRPDGLLLACIPSSGTLAELRSSLTEAEMAVSGGVSPRVLPFVDVREAGGLLQRAGLALPVTDHDAVTVRYDDALDLMHDLRAMGATNTLLARPRSVAPRALFMAAAGHYADHYTDPDGRIRATFSFVWMSGWAPDASQPRPLEPGSATHSLADVLGDRSR